MTHSHPRLFSASVFLAGAVAAAVLALAPSVAFAQRGGSAGHMGGGGGAPHFGGSGSTGGSHPAATTSHSSAKPAARTAPVTDSKRPVVTSAKNGTAGSAGARPATPGTAVSTGSGPAVAVHGNSTAPRTTVIGYPPTESSPWQAVQSHSGAVSFSGQGHEIWQDSPSRGSNSATTSAPTVAIHPQLRESVTPAMIARPTPPHKISFPAGSAPILFVPAFGYFGPAYGLGYFGNGFGCNPFSSWGFGCGGLGYGFGYGSAFGYGGYYGAGYGYDFGQGYDSSLGPLDFSGDAPSGDYGSDNSGNHSGYDSSSSSTGDGTSTDAGAAPLVSTAPGGADSAPPATTIFLKDGSNFEVMSYWLDAGKLHYITNYGGESSIDMTQLDLQRTVDENAQRGGSFTLRPAATVPAPDAAPAPEPQQ
jgi:hypothetical protein